MAWTKYSRRTPTWPVIVSQVSVGFVMLTSAVLNATRDAAEIATHADGLLTVGAAAVGGLGIGSGLEMIRWRRAANNPATIP